MPLKKALSVGKLCPAVFHSLINVYKKNNLQINFDKEIIPGGRT